MYTAKIIKGQNTEDIDLLDQMYTLRYRVFVEQLGWVLPNAECSDKDVFDHTDTHYILIIDKKETVIGCCRLIPATHPTMFSEIFPSLLGNAIPPFLPSVWEVSRLTIERRDTEYLILSHLLVAMFQHAYDCSIERIISVTDTVLERALQRVGLYTQRFSPPQKYADCEAVAGYADVSEDMINRLIQRREQFEQLTKDNRFILSVYPYEQHQINDKISGARHE